jgi:hypothetical protein
MTSKAFDNAQTLNTFVSPESFGARGDGVTDDTVALQAALDTLNEVRGKPGATYLVRRKAGKRYCLLWKSNMRWVGNGSVIKLANSEYVSSVGCSVLMTLGVDDAPATITTNTYFEGIVDGNYQNQGTITVAGNFFTPTVYVNKIANTEWDITVRNGNVLAFYTTGSSAEIYDNRLRARVEASRGGGVSLNGTRWQVSEVYAKDILWVDNNSVQGNPFIATISDSNVGQIYAENFGYGVKFQDGCENVTIGQIVAKQGAGSSTQKDRGVKFQGTSATPNKNISVGNIVVQGMQPGGLYIYETDRITIGSYIGSGNGTNGSLGENDRVDTYIVDSNDVVISSLTVEGCGQYPLITQNDSNNINIGTFTCANTPDNTPLWYNKAGSAGNVANISFDTISVRNETAGWASTINVLGGASNCYIGKVFIDVPFSNYTTAGRLIISADNTGNYLIRTGPVVFRGSRTSGVVALTNNSTSTAVADAAVMVATNGINCAPIIKIEPVSFNNNNNSSGLKRGDFTVSVGNQTTGGLTICHPPIASTGTFYARWTIEGYQAPGDSLEATGTNSLRLETNFTAAQIAAAAGNPNLGDKFTGRMVWDSTNNRMMRARGAAAADPWDVVDGSASVTPT